MALTDEYGRPLRDLRVSVTDRCNFRCTYCMPKEIFNREWEFLARDSLLSFEEITRIVGLFSRLGVTKLRITGGEPMMRRGIVDLVSRLARIQEIDDIAMTTNGSLLERHAANLAVAGLDRVSVSLDSLDNATFMAMNDAGFSVDRVLEGIDAAAAAALTPIKINMVVQRGVNDGDVLAVAEYFRDTGHIVRFIEYMDVGHTNGWRLNDVVPAAEIVDIVASAHEIEPLEAQYPGEVARRWGYIDGSGEFGVISSVSQPFCGSCVRARISAEGMLYTCLFATSGIDLRRPLRDGSSDEELMSLISKVWEKRNDRYSEIRSEAIVNLPKVEMSYIGG